MNANTQEQAALTAAGYTYEYPGFWSRFVNDRQITIADGESMNGFMWEVQVIEDGACVLATEAFSSAESAIAAAALYPIEWE